MTSQAAPEFRKVHGHAVQGIDVDAQTRCAHWQGPMDVIALRMKCCGAWFPCFECHAALADHPAQVWPLAQRTQGAVLCGVCGGVLSVSGCLACDSPCPACGAAFNPGCQTHLHLYFELD